MNFEVSIIVDRNLSKKNNKQTKKKKNRMENSVDPDEMAHYEPSHLDLHCLQRYLRLQNWNGVKYVMQLLMFPTTF